MVSVLVLIPIPGYIISELSISSILISVSVGILAWYLCFGKNHRHENLAGIGIRLADLVEH